MTWGMSAITALVVAGVFSLGWLVGYWGRWEERVRDRRRGRLVERLGRERSPW